MKALNRSGSLYSSAALIVRCQEKVLHELLADVDAREWADPEGARVFYERHAADSWVAGGMGGGAVAEDLWVHPRLSGLRLEITDVLAGLRPRIGGAG